MAEPLPPPAATAYQGQVEALATAAAAVAAAAWSAVDPAAVAASWLAQVPALTIALSAAQRYGAALAEPYLTALNADPADDEVDPAAYAGVASDGRPLASLLVQPALTVLAALGSRVPPARALAAGAATLDMIVRTQTTDAARAAVGAGITAHRELVGYVRVLSLPSCARCVILAGRRYRWNAGFARHPRCDCVHLPTRVADDGPTVDPMAYFRSLSPREQDQTFGRAGAQAVRDGADVGQVVNARSGMYVAGARRLTTTGTTRRGLYGGYEIDPETGALKRRPRGAKVPPRLMPEEIYRIAGDDRDEAIRLLRRFGYLRLP